MKAAFWIIYAAAILMALWATAKVFGPLDGPERILQPSIPKYNEDR